MAETRYNVIFNGELAAGQQIEEVKKRLAAAYKCDVAKIERTFFAGKTFIAKKDADYQTTVKVQATLNCTGAIFGEIQAKAVDLSSSLEGVRFQVFVFRTDRERQELILRRTF